MRLGVCATALLNPCMCTYLTEWPTNQPTNQPTPRILPPSRPVNPTARGKQESYMAMVAVGNQKVGSLVAGGSQRVLGGGGGRGEGR